MPPSKLPIVPCFKDLANVDIVKANRFVIIKNICKFVGLCAR